MKKETSFCEYFRPAFAGKIFKNTVRPSRAGQSPSGKKTVGRVATNATATPGGRAIQPAGIFTYQAAPRGAKRCTDKGGDCMPADMLTYAHAPEGRAETAEEPPETVYAAVQRRAGKAIKIKPRRAAPPLLRFFRRAACVKNLMYPESRGRYEPNFAPYPRKMPIPCI